MQLRIIGLMSGSSLDGLDMAYCRIEFENQIWNWAIDDQETIHFDHDIVMRLRHATDLSGLELMKLHADFGKWIGQHVANWISQRQLSPDLIGSHGHTIFHEPAHGFSTQIGCGAHIAAATGIDTICDFRAMDIALGGQGAPFAPIVDQILFSGHDAYINLGGIANISARTDHDQWKGWDISPCNQALNYLAHRLNLPFDKDGQIAASTQADELLCQSLMSDFPFRQMEPFSISNQAVLDTWIQKLDSSVLPVPVLLATTLKAIVSIISHHVIRTFSTSGSIFVTGGGAHNTHLIHQLRQQLAPHHIELNIPERKIVDFKESLLIALLAFMNHQGIAFPVHSVTGSSRNSVGGTYHTAV